MAFEANFRKEMSERIPDYRSVTFRVASEERPQDDFAVVTLAGSTADNKNFKLKIPVFQTGRGWKVVLHSAYESLVRGLTRLLQATARLRFYSGFSTCGAPCLSSIVRRTRTSPCQPNARR